MKKILIFAYSLISFGQQQELLQNTWYLTELNINNSNISIPNNTEVQSISLFINANDIMFTNVCNVLDTDSELLYDNYTIEMTKYYQTLGSCDNSNNQNFEDTYFNLFKNNINIPFYYTISTSNSNTKILTITSSREDLATYQNQQLSAGNKAKVEVNLYPNPVASDFHLEIESGKEIKSVRIFSVNGKEVLSFKEVQDSYDVSELPQGIYFVNIESKTGQSMKKMLKQ